jgi:hypothetical protein
MKVRVLKKAFKISLLSSVCVYVYLLVATRTFESIEFPNDQVADTGFYDEWVPLSKYFLLRRPSAFYFYDENLISVLAIATHDYDTSAIFCALYIASKEIKVKANLKLLQVYLKAYNKVYSIECTLENNSVELSQTIKLHIVDDRNHLLTKLAIDVKIKSKLQIQNVIKTKGEFLLCTDYIYVKSREIGNFEKWIEYNKKIGFEKIVFYNHSIPNEPGFNKLFSKYQDFIEIRSYKYFASLDENLYVEKIEKPQNDFDHLHQRVCTNECYMSYKSYFKRIAIFDQDEMIIPQPLADPQAVECLNSSHSDLATYFDQLGQKQEYRDAKSFWFPYAQALYNSDAEKLRSQLEKVLRHVDSQKPEGKIFVSKGSIPNYFFLVFRIRNKKDLFYARELKRLYDAHFDKYDDSRLYESGFFTLLSVYLDAHRVFTGKSIHLTDSVKYVEQHFALHFNSTKVSKAHGYVMHFRQKMKTAPGEDIINLSIQELFVNSYYLKCIGNYGSL